MKVASKHQTEINLKNESFTLELLEKLITKSDKIFLKRNDEAIFLSTEDTVLLKLKIDTAPSNGVAIEVELNDSKLITPYLDNYHENSYSFSYQTLATTNKNFYELPYIILKNQNLFLIIKVDFLDSYLIKMIDTEKKLLLFFDKLLNIDFRIAKNIYDFYKTKLKNSYIPIISNNIGYIHNFNDNNTSFANIKKTLNQKTINVILKDIDIMKIFYDKEYQSNLETVLFKLKLYNFNYFLEFDNHINVIDEKIDKDLPIIKKRDGDPAKNNDKLFLDVFNENGRKVLNEFYKKLLSISPKGLFIKRDTAYFEKDEIFDKAVCKYNNEIIPYKKNIKTEIKIKNIILKNIKLEEKRSIFFSSTFTKENEQSIFLLKAETENQEKILLLFEELFSQLYYNIGLSIEKSPSILQKLLPILLIPTYIFFDNNIMEKLENSPLLESFISVIKLRNSMTSYIDLSYNEFINKGKPPLKVDKKDSILNGYYLGDSVYVSLIQERFLDSLFNIPEGLWYILDDDILVTGNSFYINRESKEGYKLLLKKEAILLCYKDSLANPNCIPNKILFYIFADKKIEKEIEERVIIDNIETTITHCLKLDFLKNCIQLEYSSDLDENIKREITFILISSQNKSIINAFMDDKKILFRKKENYIEFSINHKKSFLIEFKK